MKLITLGLFTALTAFPQFPNQWIGANVNFDQYSENKVTGSLAYAKQISSGTHPIYSYNAVNLVSVQKNPFRLMTNPESGLAIHVATFSNFQVFALGSAGVALSGNNDGTNAGFSGSGGGFAQTKLKGNWTIGPIVRISKSTISEIQWSIGLVIGLGSN
jgi:hypothetical protein